LGGSAAELLAYTTIDDLTDEGAIVIAPESRGRPNEWDTYDGADKPDFVLFDDLLTCAHEQFGVDLDRGFSTGMSAGGLFTVSLTHHRSERLAASAPLSGGATLWVWEPTEPVPMLLTWGGPSDYYGSYSFEQANFDLTEQLVENEQFVAHCIHGAGHIPPPGGTDYLWTFFEAHPRGVSPSPWANSLDGSGLPDWCSLPPSE
jgi:dienelactone hydrolase